MEYKDTKDFIYNNVSKRIQEHKKESNLTYYQIAGYENKVKYEKHEPIKAWENYDIAIIKSISKGKIYKKRNPYLISDLYVDRFTYCLKFKDKLELLWGNFENRNFSKIFFQKLCIDVLWGRNLELKSFLNNILIDYVPYAKALSFWEMFYTNEIDIANIPRSKYKIHPQFYGLNDDKTFEDFEPRQLEAINYLYEKCFLDFDEKMIYFIKNNGDSFKKLDDKIHYFVEKEVINMLMDYKLDEFSLGLRARNLIISDWRSWGNIVSRKMDEDSKMIDDSVKTVLIKSTLEYINVLDVVQKELIDMR
ncbi:hypothetical protein [Lactococcus petauri]|uniref:hypothetical protein n=1 Tax=Lactococcus petauri TaxID=1940789 RepID=UPI0022E26AD7|nr:hypothetical protein [Lactococcus petauri]